MQYLFFLILITQRSTPCISSTYHCILPFIFYKEVGLVGIGRCFVIIFIIFLPVTKPIFYFFICLLKKINWVVFPLYLYLYVENNRLKKQVIMENSNKNQHKTLDDRTRQLISQKLKNRSKSFTHKQNISKGLTDYWKSVPNAPNAQQ